MNFFDFDPAQAEAAQRERIEKDGYGIVLIMTDDPVRVFNPWMHTYGFALKDRPDFIATGFLGKPVMENFKFAIEQFSELNGGYLPDGYTQATIVLRDLCFHGDDGETQGVRVRVSVAPMNEMVSRTMEICWKKELGLSGPKSVYQVIWPDLNNILPGEEGYENEFNQPELGF